MDRGTYLILDDGRPAVRFRRRYAHSPQRVWAAVTDPTQLSVWFPATVTFEPRAGGTITFTGDDYAADMTGTVLTFEPPTRFAFTWGADEVHLDVTPDADGAILTLLNVLERRDASARNAAGWDVCLRELDKVVDDVETAGPHSDSAQPWQPLYDAYVAAGLPAGAPVPGVDG